MDCKYFINDSGKFVAKKLPAPSGCAVKIKDVSDISMFRCDLADYLPNLDCQFIELYERNFDSPYDYEVEVETFEETVLRNRSKFLEENSWLKKWHEDIAYHFDDNPDEEWQYLDDDLSKILIKNHLAVIKEDIDDDDLTFALNRYLLVDLKEIAKPAGIKVTQKKKALINEIIDYHNNNGKEFIENPIFVKLSPNFIKTIDSLKQKYISQIDEALKSFPYPDNFKAAVWDEICSNHEDIIYELARDKIRELGNKLDSWYMSNSRHQQSYQAETKPTEISIPISKSANNYLPNAELVWKDTPVAVSFGYRNYSGDESYRTVNVSQILVDKEKGAFYLYGFCNKRGELRHFRHSSIITKLDVDGRKLSFDDWMENDLGLKTEDIFYCNTFRHSPTYQEEKATEINYLQTTELVSSYGSGTIKQEVSILSPQTKHSIQEGLNKASKIFDDAKDLSFVKQIISNFKKPLEKSKYHRLQSFFIFFVFSFCIYINNKSDAPLLGAILFGLVIIGIAYAIRYFVKKIIPNKLWVITKGVAYCFVLLIFLTNLIDRFN